MKKRVVMICMMALAFAVCAFPAFATGETTVSSAMTSAFGSIASDAQSLIAAVIPVAVPILGAIVLITIGIRVFRKITGR